MSPCEPGLGVENGAFFPDLEVEGAVPRGIASNGAQRLAGGYFLALTHAHGGKVAIYGHVAAVTHDDVLVSVHGEYV